MKDTWKWKKTVTEPSKMRFPPTDGLCCSQCERSFDDKTIEFGGAYLDTPVCEDCIAALIAMNRSLLQQQKSSTKAATSTFEPINPTFNEEETKTIFNAAMKRATEWAGKNPEYTKAVELLRPYFWAKKTYNLPDRPEPEEEQPEEPKAPA